MLVFLKVVLDLVGQLQEFFDLLLALHELLDDFGTLEAIRLALIQTTHLVVHSTLGMLVLDLDSKLVKFVRRGGLLIADTFHKVVGVCHHLEV